MQRSGYPLHPRIMHRLTNLRIGCHNVNGLTAKVDALAAHWQQLGMDIVVAVDTHTDYFSTTALKRTLQSKGWHGEFCAANMGVGRPTAGIAVIIKNQLLLHGVLQIVGPVTTPTSGQAQGRLLHLPLSWAGQRFDIIGVYLHAADAHANVSIIAGPLTTACQTAHNNLIVLGDFNFVPCPAMDRRTVSTHPPHLQTRDMLPSAAWAQHLQHLHDSWRVLHPHRRAYTYVRTDAASRIDRIYVSNNLLPQLVATTHADHNIPVSDHWLVRMQLLPHGHGVLGPGIARLHLSLQSDAFCQQCLRDWLHTQQPPADAAAVLDSWWPAFKQQLRAKIHELNSLARQRRRTHPFQAQQAVVAAEVVRAHDRVGTCTETQLPAALNALMAARESLAVLQTQQEQLARARRRQQWVHTGERPGPAMSKVLQPPKAGTFIPGLTAPGSGHLVCGGVGMAHIMGNHYASVCAAQFTQPAARDAVLQAVAAHSTRLSAVHTTNVGAAAVTAEEIVVAIAATAPGKAPGLDGIPGELFRHYRLELAPLLSAVYSAIGGLARVPTGFLDGVILPILKPGGHRTDPAAYRPIQLLNYDYRILAKVLANRMLPLIGSTIHPAQCAFVPGRQIKDSIRMLQLLPALLNCRAESAVAVFTDFTKAYDTVDRTFLCMVADTLGVGAGFQQWMKTLLTNTYTRAIVNGFLSGAYKCEAGVRQGCPLSPLLYLFVGQALWCWLKHNNIGIQVADYSLTSTQYADDAEPFLPALTQVPHFQRCMNEFAAASGQHLNISKTQLLPIGQHVISTAINNDFTVATTAKSLGLMFSSNGRSDVDWDARLTKVKHRLQKISDIPRLSAFGRAFATNAYALSTILYAAQFASLPHTVSQQLNKWTSALVDAKLSPEDSLRRAPGIPTTCLCAHPRDGGMGLLPLQPHLLARWACEGRDLLMGSKTIPWVGLACALWHHWTQLQHPRVQAAGGDIWGLLLCDQHTLLALPEPLKSFAHGLRALPPMEQVRTQALDVASCCWSAPLWSNPLFASQQHWATDGQQQEVVVGLEHVAPEACLNLPFLQSVGQAILLRHELQRVCASNTLAAHANFRMSIWPVYLQSRQAFADRHIALQHIENLVALLPRQWVQAAENYLQLSQQPVTTLMSVSEQDITATRRQLSVCLGWPASLVSRHCRTPITFDKLTVATATRLQQSPAVQAIATRHTTLLTTIAAIDAVQQQQLPPVTSVLARWWQLKVANIYKEAAWRLSLNAFPTAQRMHLSTPCPACGHISPGLDHLFWSCPVATTVRDKIEQQLRAVNMLPTDQPVSCAAVWLGQPPHPLMHRMIWDMVCLAGIYAMDIGRRTSWAVGQRLTTSQLVADIASRAATAAFWDALADFAATCNIHKKARTALLTRQPFIVWCTVLATGTGLRVIRH